MTIRIEQIDEKALALLRQLERMNILKMTLIKPAQPKPVSWSGMIKSPSSALLNYADNVRDEWEDRI